MFGNRPAPKPFYAPVSFKSNDPYAGKAGYYGYDPKNFAQQTTAQPSGQAVPQQHTTSHLTPQSTAPVNIPQQQDPALPSPTVQPPQQPNTPNPVVPTTPVNTSTAQPQQWAGPMYQHQTPMKRNYWMGNKITNPQNNWQWRQPNPNQLASGLRA